MRFLKQITMDIFCHIILCSRGCPMHCRMFNSIPGLSLSTEWLPLSQLWWLKISPDTIAKCPLWEKLLLVENHWSSRLYFWVSCTNKTISSLRSQLVYIEICIFPVCVRGSQGLSHIQWFTETHKTQHMHSYDWLQWKDAKQNQQRDKAHSQSL